MRKGFIDSEPSPDRQGDTLGADVVATDTVLEMAETAMDFDRDDTDTTWWLVIGDSDPLQYESVDLDADTVTLTEPLAADYEAGLPVTLWDPTVPGGGAQVVEYVASVRLSDGSGTALATIPHELIPLNGVGNLVGASVGIDDEDDDEWEVKKVYSREAAVDQGAIEVPFLTLYRSANVSIADSASFAALTGWTVQGEAETYLTPDAVTGEVTVAQGGLYLFTVAVNWAGNTSGRRYIRIMTTLSGVSTVLRTIPGAPPDAQAMTQQIVVAYQVTAGETVRVEVQQTSGAALDVRGDAAGRLTAFQIVRVQA
jgi:hypothetical protein